MMTSLAMSEEKFLFVGRERKKEMESKTLLSTEEEDVADGE
jgi:hypothetical protein